MTADLGGPRTAKLLNRLGRAIAWKELRAPVPRLLDYCEQRGVGRRAWHPETMPPALLLAKWFNLGDAQFEKRGLRVKEGTLVDATVIELSRGATRDDGTSRRYPEASFTKKSGQTHFGFEGHIAADRSSLVTDDRFSDATPRDSNLVDELTEDETGMVADAAYRSEERERRLLACGVVPVIAFKRQRGETKLAKEPLVFNRIVTSLRAVVEHPFAWITRTGDRRVRYRGLRRHEFDFALHLVAYNWQRSLSLARA